jgi:hypothetical protein
MMLRFLSISLTAILCRNVEAFSPLSAVGRHQAQSIISHDSYSTTATAPRTLVTLDAAADGKKKRRRKQAPGTTSADPVQTSLEKVDQLQEEDDIDDLTEEEVDEIGKVAKFKFTPDGGKDVVKGKCIVQYGMEWIELLECCFVLTSLD